MESYLGKLLDGTYRIDQLLGKGGMGAVYRAHDVTLDRDVAIKVMHAHFTDEESFRARFLQEARAIAALDHPGIVEVHAFGQDLGLLYIVMDFVPGQTLHAWLKRLATEKKIIGLNESLDIVQHVALALHYAHEKGVLHRDIKPSNIMLKPADPALGEPDDLPLHPVLTDFGLAKLAEGGVHTLTGTSMGTPAYMSPEQCLGLELDRGADIYSLGVVLFELTTGRVPFEIKSLTEAIRRHTQEPPPPPRSVNPSLPVEVENIILRALSKRREDRYQTAREMAGALKAAIPRIPTGLTIAPVRVGEPVTDRSEEGVSTDTEETLAYVSLMDQATQPPPISPPPMPAEPARAVNPLDVFVATPEVSVTPGSQVTCTFTVFNQGSAPGRFGLAISGIPADWIPSPVSVIQLLPGTHQEVRLGIQPPRGPQSRAGRYGLTIQVSNLEAPGQRAQATATMTVAPFVQFRCGLKPAKPGAGKSAQVSVQNQGNTSETFSLQWQDPVGELAFEPPQAQLTVDVGQVGAATFRAAPRQNRWLGGAKAHSFTTTIRSSAGHTQRLDGEVLSQGLIPLWVPLVVAFLCVGLVAAVALILGPKVFSTAVPTATRPPTAAVPTDTLAPNTPVATATSPAATFTVPPTAGATATQPSSTDTPEPTPGTPGMVLVPAGEFVQGSTPQEIQKASDDCAQGDTLCAKSSLEDELPRHVVQVDAFYIDEHEVTNGEYAECVAAGACESPSPVSSNTRGTYFQDPAFADYPVVYVRWEDADAYCRWAGKRLPTEAEWEKAARGPDGLLWPWGNVLAADRLNFRPAGTAPDTSDTVRVGTFPNGASPYGALDMVGNVWEWVADWYAPSYEGQSPGPNPTGPAAGDRRVIRGGSWNSNIAGARAAGRAGAPPEQRYFDVGFRCAQ